MRWLVILFVVSFVPASVLAQTPAEADFFTKKARPILEKHCFSCHSHAANKAKGQLVVDSRTALLKGGETGPAIDLQHPHKSLLVKAIEYADDDLRMPPKGKLADDEIAILKEWVVKGAIWPGAEKTQAKTGHVPGVITAADRAWWAFQPVKATPPPTVKDADWNQHPIDRFLLARLEKEGLKPAPRADKVALIRRVTFDLIGLPPTPEEVDAFVRDVDPKAHEKLVDRLLASPRYGERMARHWLDLVRFAETDGFRLDTYRASAWRYRDYVEIGRAHV